MANPNAVPPPPGKGRIGPNKVTVAAKEALELAFEGAGGVPALVAWAEKNPDGFYPVWARLLPKNLDVTSGGKPLSAQERTDRLAAILAILEGRAKPVAQPVEGGAGATDSKPEGP